LVPSPGVTFTVPRGSLRGSARPVSSFLPNNPSRLNMRPSPCRRSSRLRPARRRVLSRSVARTNIESAKKAAGQSPPLRKGGAFQNAPPGSPGGGGVPAIRGLSVSGWV
jgi:hypothetical protein